MITSSDFAYYYPEVVDRTASNGGKRSYNLIPVSQRGAIVPAASVADATTGATMYSKFFVKLTNLDNEPLYNAGIALLGLDAGDDSFYFTKGTSVDTQADAQAYTFFTGGVIEVAVTAGDTVITVTTENGDGLDAANQMIVYENGVFEIFDVDSIAFTGNSATVNVAAAYNGGSGLKNSYSTSAKVSSVISVGNVTTGWAEVANPDSLTITGDILTYNAGTITGDFSVSFDSTTSYTIYDSAGNQLLTGCSISADVSVQNPNEATGNYYFTIPAGFFSGVATGNTYSFSTTAAEVPVWIKRVIPAGATPASVDAIEFGIFGEAV